MSEIWLIVQLKWLSDGTNEWMIRLMNEDMQEMIVVKMIKLSFMSHRQITLT